MLHAYSEILKRLFPNLTSLFLQQYLQRSMMVDDLFEPMRTAEGQKEMTFCDEASDVCEDKLSRALGRVVADSTTARSEFHDPSGTGAI